jgi:thiamine biosynthesis protein ThiI
MTPSEPETGVILASSEFVLKSAPVRRTLEQRLIDDLRICLKTGGFDEFTIEKRSARILIRGLTDAARAASVVSDVFGVAYAAEVTITAPDLNEILGEIMNHASKAIGNGQSFAVRSHGTKISRRDIETRGGAEILGRLKERRLKGDLKNPDVLISVDVMDDLALIYHNKIRGPGGLPISSQWKMLGVLDSGLLSILAAYVMMRRGSLVELFIPVSLRVQAFSERSQLLLARKLRTLVTRSQYRAHVVGVDSLLRIDATQSAVKTAAKRLALNFAVNNKFRGLVLSDVSGMLGTLASESVPIDSGRRVPIFRPLLGLTSEELLALCELANLPATDLKPELVSPADDSDAAQALIFTDDLRVDTVSLGLVD